MTNLILDACVKGYPESLPEAGFPTEKTKVGKIAAGKCAAGKCAAGKIAAGN